MRTICTVGAISLPLLAAVPQALAHEEIDIGRDSVGRLVMEIAFKQPFPLPVSIFPGIDGFASGELGFNNLSADEPANDLYMLSPSSSIEAMLIAQDAGVQVFNGLPVLPVGGAMHFGPPFFDYHPVFNIYNGVVGNTYSLQFQLHDANGIHTDSAVTTISFTPVPEPRALLLSALAAFMFSARAGQRCRSQLLGRRLKIAPAGTSS